MSNNVSTSVSSNNITA